MLTALLGRIIIIIFGALHPSYRTYKAIKKKDYQEVVILGMYWVVFSLFTTVELITDIFLAWLPFYYEVKIGLVIWLVNPATSGYSIIYRKLIHPELSKREKEIDNAIQRATEQGCTKFVEFGAKGLNYAAKVVLSTAITGQDMFVDQLRRRSASMVELNQPRQRTLPSSQRHPFGAGDHTDQSGMQTFASSPHPPNTPSSLEDDPFALNWLHPGSTGSLGRKWRPPLHQGLYQVPEDAENSSESTSAEQPTPRTAAPTKRSTTVTQTFLKMVSQPKPGRVYSSPISTSLPGSPFTRRPPPSPLVSSKPPAPPPPTAAPVPHSPVHLPQVSSRPPTVDQ